MGLSPGVIVIAGNDGAAAGGDGIRGAIDGGEASAPNFFMQFVFAQYGHLPSWQCLLELYNDSTAKTLKFHHEDTESQSFLSFTYSCLRVFVVRFSPFCRRLIQRKPVLSAQRGSSPAFSAAEHRCPLLPR
jgi:hypothetical protein